MNDERVPYKEMHYKSHEEAHIGYIEECGLTRMGPGVMIILCMKED
jgi:hypothetical protein